MSNIDSIAVRYARRYAKSLAKQVDQTAGAAAQAVEKALTPEQQAVVKRLLMLKQTNAFASLDSKVLIKTIEAGKIVPNSQVNCLRLHSVDKPRQVGNEIALMVLSNKGKQKVAAADGAKALDPYLEKPAVGWVDQRHTIPTELDVHQDIQYVLLDPTSYGKVMEKYAEAIKEGKVPAQIAGKPYSQFFRRSDDMRADLLSELYSKIVPGFAKKERGEQKAIVSLAERLAGDFPSDVPATTRRKVAATLIETKRYDHPVDLAQFDKPGEVWDFYHGRHIVPKDGRKALRPPEELVNEGFHPDQSGTWGKGVYWGNASVAQAYGYSGTDKGSVIVFGKVAVGKHQTTADNAGFDSVKDIKTRWVPNSNDENGAYHVTKNPKRLFIQGIARYYPERTEGVTMLIPDLLEAFGKSPRWAAGYLGRVNAEQAERALQHAIGNGTPEVQRAASLLLGTVGDAKGMELAIQTLQKGSDKEKEAAIGILGSWIRSIAPNRADQVKPLVSATLEKLPVKDQAFLGRDLLVKHGDTYADLLVNHPSAVVRQKAGIALAEKGDARGIVPAIEGMASNYSDIKAEATKAVPAWLENLDPAKVGESQEAIAAALKAIDGKTAVAMVPTLIDRHGEPILATLLSHPRDIIRQKAGATLAARGDQQGVAMAIQGMGSNTADIKTESQKAVRTWVENLDPAKLEESRATLIEALAAQDKANVYTPVKELLEKQGEPVWDLLLSHPSGVVNQKTALALVARGEPRGMAKTIEAIGSKYGDIKTEAPKAVGAWVQNLDPARFEESKSALSAALEALEKNNLYTPVKELLDKQGAPVWELLLGHTSPGVRQKAGIMLIGRGEERGVPAAIEAMGSKFTDLKAEAPRAVAGWVTNLDPARLEASKPALAQALKALDAGTVNGLVPKVLEKHGEPVFETLLTQSGDLVRLRAGLALTAKGDARGVPLAIEALDGKVAEVKKDSHEVVANWLANLEPAQYQEFQPQVAGALGKLDPVKVPEAVGALVGRQGEAPIEMLLAHKTDLVRQKAGVALMATGDLRGLPGAIGALSGADKAVKAEAEKALPGWIMSLDPASLSSYRSQIESVLDKMDAAALNTQLPKLLRQHGQAFGNQVLGYERNHSVFVVDWVVAQGAKKLAANEGILSEALAKVPAEELPAVLKRTLAALGKPVHPLLLNHAQEGVRSAASGVMWREMPVGRMGIAIQGLFGRGPAAEKAAAR